ncbi:MAG: 2,3-bisphosphoglycerate-dependent phosphoglycerate mutase [Rhabdochlamydiaceae bacterium]|nr:2,3-bisphosphoglycerate-dependent phosphoglycerate mutase [Candidatus Amphrikana amoebophyrae]
MKKPILILLRHGQSVWNKKNIFTGWVDIPLTREGINEAIKAGHLIDKIDFSAVYTSDLIRAQMTACLAMSVHSGGRNLAFQHEGDETQKNMQVNDEKNRSGLIPVYKSWHLNERMYGDLQGLNKASAAEEFGQEQVQTWRRSFDIAPPNGESLELTASRTLPYFEQKIVPHLKSGENILVSAHGNSLRSIVYSIEGMSKEDILAFEIPTGVPLAYVYDNGKFVKADLNELNK